MPPIAEKTMGTLKLLTGAANRRKTMGTLKLLTESMQYNFELALNHVRVIRSFFYKLSTQTGMQTQKHKLENSSLLGGLIKNRP